MCQKQNFVTLATLKTSSSSSFETCKEAPSNLWREWAFQLAVKANTCNLLEEEDQNDVQFQAIERHMQLELLSTSLDITPNQNDLGLFFPPPLTPRSSSPAPIAAGGDLPMVPLRRYNHS